MSNKPSENLTYWTQFDRPPAEALKQIGGGRLKGMTDVNPQWRYKIMTEVFGPCGVGWKFSIDRIWTENGPAEQRAVFVQVSVQINTAGQWSEPIPGIGGSILVAQETAGLRLNDEAVKMATTDALSTAFKLLGVAADIYMGRWDGSNYRGGDGKSEHRDTSEGLPRPNLSTYTSQKLTAAKTEADIAKVANGILQMFNEHRLTEEESSSLMRMVAVRRAQLAEVENQLTH